MTNGCTHSLSILLSKEIAEVNNLIIFQVKTKLFVTEN